MPATNVPGLGDWRPNPDDGYLPRGLTWRAAAAGDPLLNNPSGLQAPERLTGKSRLAGVARMASIPRDWVFKVYKRFLYIFKALGIIVSSVSGFVAAGRSRRKKIEGSQSGPYC